MLIPNQYMFSKGAGPGLRTGSRVAQMLGSKAVIPIWQSHAMMRRPILNPARVGPLLRRAAASPRWATRSRGPPSVAREIRRILNRRAEPWLHADLRWPHCCAAGAAAARGRPRPASATRMETKCADRRTGRAALLASLNTLGWVLPDAARWSAAGHTPEVCDAADRR